MKTIQKHNAHISTEQLIEWACYNGARALMFDDLGSIEVGKSPGLVHISHLGPNVQLQEQSSAKRIC